MYFLRVRAKSSSQKMVVLKLSSSFDEDIGITSDKRQSDGRQSSLKGLVEWLDD